MARFPGGSALVAVLLSVAAGGSAWAQGGWRQWDVVLRNGTRLVANPLGTPDTLSFSRSVGGFETKEDVIPRRRVDYLAAGDPRGPLPPEAIRPAAPIGMKCEDTLIFWDGRKTVGRVSLTRIQWSEGVVTQNGVEVDLTEVAFIKFGRPSHVLCRKSGD